MVGSERKAVISIAILYATRMLGLFMVLPVFAIAGQGLDGATSMLIGVAIGAYGLSQSLLQIPFGALSDRFGRKNMIVLGLVIFFLGSVIAALSESIYGVILGRFLQGAGAIASVLMALVSDLTTEESRTKSMALIGMSIGVSFSLALVLGPLFLEWGNLSLIFWVTAAMAAFGIFWVIKVVPSPLVSKTNRDTQLLGNQLKDILSNKELVRLDFGIFALHMCLTAVFLAIPLSLVQRAGVETQDHWWVYLSVLVLSFFAMVPFIIVGEKKRKMKPIFIFAISLLGLSALSLAFTGNSFALFWSGLFFFFLAFNLLEASLPSLVSKIAPAGGRGTAMGVYSTSQFFGAFVGGIMGGFLLGQIGESGVYVGVALTVMVWVFVAKSMAPPRAETGLAVRLNGLDGKDDAVRALKDLESVPGVREAVVVFEDAIAYLKVDKDIFSEDSLPSICVSSSRP